MTPSQVCTTILFAAGCVAYGQSFEVASVKVSHAPQPGGRGMHGGGPPPVEHSPGTISLRNASLAAAIQYAYDVKEFQVTGPAWLNTERYDIFAKAGSVTPESELRVMLQGLLAERFKLALHRETKEMSVYVLVQAKGGHKLHESEGEGEPSFDGNRLNATAKNQTMSALVGMMSNAFLGRPVLDQTGLTKRYDFKVDLTGMIAPDMQPDDMINILTKLVQDQLGLKLEPKKAAVELLIVDHAEKIPTEN
jgi:uncharacterized protein (TIGR03435 family)